MSQYVIDRIENGWAALEGENAKVFNVPADWLPTEAREGDILEANTEGPASGIRVVRFTLDAEARQEREAGTRELRAKLPRGPGGDLAL